MNRGDIPGYYFDQEKKKYFKIQPNHAVPTHVKHSQANVAKESREQRKTKRRKVHEIERRRQRITPGRMLQSNLLNGAGLQRELGHASSSRTAAERDCAIVNSLYSDDVELFEEMGPSVRYTDALYFPQESSMLLTGATSGRCYVRIVPWSGYWRSPFYELPPDAHWSSLPRDVSADRMEDISRSGRTSCLVYGNLGGSLAWYTGKPLDNRTGFPPQFEYASIAAWDHAFDPNTNRIAFVGTGILVVDGGSHGWFSNNVIKSKHFDDDEESFTTTWYQPNMLAYGHSKAGRRQTSHGVKLLDIRVDSSGAVDDSVTRITRKARVTGVATSPDLPQHLVVTDNRSIDIYDLRMIRSNRFRPYMSIPHTSGNTRANMALDGSILAMEDQDSLIEVYSLRTAERLRTLRTSTELRGRRLGQLRFQEDETGAPYLQSCAGFSIHRWAWRDE